MKLKILVSLVSLMVMHLSIAAADDLSSIRGESKYSVEEKFGQPRNIYGPVGSPPITRWVYSDFSVVFEYDHVIHAFARKQEIENLPLAPRPSPSSGDDLYIPD